MDSNSKRVKISRFKILDAQRSYFEEFGYFNWCDFGLEWTSPNLMDRFLYFDVLDKDKLTWAIIKYGFNVYNVDSCY